MTITNVPDPRDLSLARWAAELALQDANVPYGAAEPRWQGWAARVVTYAKFVGQNLPDPYQFKDWRAWATALKRAVG